MLTLYLQGIDAAIFDMDGTMVENDNYHKLAWIEFGKRNGLKLSEKDYNEKIKGRKNNDILPMLFNRDLSEAEIKQYAENKETIYREIYKKDIKEVNGLKDFISLLKSAGLKLALATTSYKPNRDFVLKAIGLSDVFDMILGDEDTTKGKPDPEIYIKTAEKLKIDPSKCIVFEDTNAGVEAAKKAGMKVIALLTSHTKEELENANHWIKDFTDLQVK